MPFIENRGSINDATVNLKQQGYFKSAHKDGPDGVCYTTPDTSTVGIFAVRICKDCIMARIEAFILLECVRREI